ncbi:MarR family winged helix-turn-helix transcriptional regulator [Noviherbaspirillum massiliense]|uniref:MarR family winged helix-turn-helix transcriptional regulator n=1 Tax=Noviherbaspirillum massiliense TaxID=1465823 RepID=UPI0002D2EE0A|nr:MarR family transcriptional regulator [Noviherbaspirillum massiliense]
MQSSITIQEKFGIAIGEVGRAWRAKLNKMLKPLGMSQSKWRALLYISRAPQGMTQAELAAMLGIEAPTATRLIKQLEEAGWVSRRPLPSDARCKMVHLTARAQEVIIQIDAAVKQLRAETLGRLSAEQAKAGLEAVLALQERLDQL